MASNDSTVPPRPSGGLGSPRVVGAPTAAKTKPSAPAREHPAAATAPGTASTIGGSTRTADRYFELKSEIHRKLIGVINLDRVSSIPKERIRSEIT